MGIFVIYSLKTLIMHSPSSPLVADTHTQPYSSTHFLSFLPFLPPQPHEFAGANTAEIVVVRPPQRSSSSSPSFSPSKHTHNLFFPSLLRFPRFLADSAVGGGDEVSFGHFLCSPCVSSLLVAPSVSLVFVSLLPAVYISGDGEGSRERPRNIEIRQVSVQASPIAMDLSR